MIEPRNTRPGPHPDLQASNKTNSQIEEVLARIDSVCKGRTPSPSTLNPGPRIFTAQRPVLGVRCPQCNKRALRRDKVQTAVTRLAALILFRPYRCRYCRYSEYRFLFDKSVSIRKS